MSALAYEVVVTATAVVHVTGASSPEEAQRLAREKFSAAEWSSLDSDVKSLETAVDADRSRRHADHEVDAG